MLTPDPASDKIELLIECLSFRDLYENQAMRPKRDEDFGAHYLFVESAPHYVPEYQLAQTAIAADQTARPRNDPEHLCPGCYYSIA